MEVKNYFAQDSQGNAQPNATCYLYAVGTETLVTGLTNITGQAITNPFHSDSFGLIQFKAPNGVYDLRVVSGVRDYRIRVQCNDLNEAIETTNTNAALAVAAAQEAAESAIKANTINLQFPFNFVAGKSQYDVSVISGRSDINTTSLALIVEGTIVSDFTITSDKIFTLNSTTMNALADGAQMWIIVNSRFDDLISNFDELQDGFTAEFEGEKVARTLDYYNYLKNLQLEPSVAYTTGLSIVRPTQTVTQSGVLYRPLVTALPITTTTWATDASKFVVANDMSLRSELISNDIDKGFALLGGSKLPLVSAIKYGLQTIVSAGDPTIWDYAYLVVNRPNIIDPKTWDWTPAIQAAIDFGGPCKFPCDYGSPAVYLISSCLQVRWNRRTSLYGPPGDRPMARIQTTTTFTDRSMLRQWDESFYTAGETNRDERPVDFTAYSSRVDRYLNLRNMEFYINSAAGGEVTCIDMVAMQETSRFDGLMLNGASGIEKGWPIRIRTGGGGEVSMNGAVLSNITVYGGGWRGELKATGSGSDLRVNGWVTANTAHKESPFQIGIIGTVIRDLHCEAYSVGNPTFDITGTDVRISEPPIIVIQNGQGDVIRCTNSHGSGFGYSGAVMTGARLYPAGGVTSNVTNLASINLYNDTSQLIPIVVPLVVNGGIPGIVVSLSRVGAELINNGVSKIYNFTNDPKTGYIAYTPSGGNTSTVILKDAVIVITDDMFKSGMVEINWSAGSASGATGNDYFNNPQSGRITLNSSFNGSETRRKARLYTDGAPALFSTPVWDAVAGTLSLTVLVNCTNLKMMATYI